MKYYVLFTDVRCNIKLAEFFDIETRRVWAANLLLDNLGNEDVRIEMMFEGIVNYSGFEIVKGVA